VSALAMLNRSAGSCEIMYASRKRRYERFHSWRTNASLPSSYRRRASASRASSARTGAAARTTQATISPLTVSSYQLGASDGALPDLILPRADGGGAAQAVARADVDLREREVRDLPPARRRRLRPRAVIARHRGERAVGADRHVAQRERRRRRRHLRPAAAGPRHDLAGRVEADDVARRAGGDSL